MSTDSFPPLDGFGPTKETLHYYVRAIGVVTRAHAEAHPKWWHISLKVTPSGLATTEMPLPDGGTFTLTMDLRRHQVVLSTNAGPVQEFSMTEGLTATVFGDQILGAVSRLGLDAEYARERFENDEPREYDKRLAERFFTAVSTANRLFHRHLESMPGEFGQVNFWPHGFDLSLEWFGTRKEVSEEHGKVTEYPSQLNLGYYPGDGGEGSYFYSNPWPFEQDKLVKNPLPPGARWFLEEWQGSILPYNQLAGDENAEDRLLEYARAVFEISTPTLLA